eukprot:6732491-Prymnesium_polylepis.1
MRASRAGRLAGGQCCAIRVSSSPKSRFSLDVTVSTRPPIDGTTHRRHRAQGGAEHPASNTAQQAAEP